MPEQIRWRLLYEGGVTVDEPPEGGSIVESWAKAQELHLINERGHAMMRISLEGGALQPIFYRVREQSAQMIMGPRGMQLGGGISLKPQGGPRLAAVVFGRGQNVQKLDLENKTGQQKSNTQLWAYVDGQAVPCPMRFFDQGQVDRQLTAVRSERKPIVV